MRRFPINPWVAGVVLALLPSLTGCGVYQRQGVEPARVQPLEDSFARRSARLGPELEGRILALDPNNVTAQDLRGVLAQAPAPRIINIHGGMTKVIPRMVSFSEFLIGMGYPAASVSHPADGTYSFSCFESSEKIAGAIACMYEKEGLRPMIVGHSQGGMQAVKVLYKLAGATSTSLHVWNPLTWEKEDRHTIVDPLSGQPRPVAGLQLPYVTSVGAGGLTRILPNQWDMTFRLHTIPDSVEEFTGFCKRNDLLGGDYLGYGPANHYTSHGTAIVRNVWLPTEYKHGTIPDTKHLLKDPRMVDWINHYRPESGAVSTPTLGEQFAADSSHILWAADVWYSIRKHWVLELQRQVRAWQTREARQ